MSAATLREQVRDRAGAACEYCQIPERLTVLSFQIDHIVALKHGGSNSLENLAFVCAHCNSYKGPNVAGVHPASKEITRLYNPRQDSWREHFQWNGEQLLGLTPVGDVTIAVLRINLPLRASVRAALIEEEIFPTARSTARP